MNGKDFAIIMLANVNMMIGVIAGLHHDFWILIFANAGLLFSTLFTKR